MLLRRTRVLVAVVAVLAVAAAGTALYLFQPWRLVLDREVTDRLPVQAGPSTGAGVVESVLAGGSFVSHEHSTTGRLQLVRLADGRRQVLLQDLDTSDGPDLRVWLTDRAVVPGRAGWGVFDDGRWLELGRLRGNRGDQVYDVPASADLSGITSVSIWCKRFAVSFGAAPLQAG